MRRRIAWGHASPSIVVLLLATANVAAFMLSAGANGIPSTERLVADGALTASALPSGEYWRLVACGFLHANAAHLLGNMVSLFVCGPALERRLGPTSFTLVYFTALVCGSLTSVATHSTVFVSVGASGAILGLFGGLFALWILGKTHLPARFFFINFGLLGMSNLPGSNVDWAAHLGGFGAGMASVALLDLLGRGTATMLMADRRREQG